MLVTAVKGFISKILTLLFSANSLKKKKKKKCLSVFISKNSTLYFMDITIFKQAYICINSVDFLIIFNYLLSILTCFLTYFLSISYIFLRIFIYFSFPTKIPRDVYFKECGWFWNVKFNTRFKTSYIKN